MRFKPAFVLVAVILPALYACSDAGGGRRAAAGDDGDVSVDAGRGSDSGRAGDIDGGKGGDDGGAADIDGGGDAAGVDGAGGSDSGGASDINSGEDAAGSGGSGGTGGVAGTGGSGGSGGITDPGWTPLKDKSLVWSDEFDGPSIDTSKWSHETGASGWGNNEWENYTDSSQNSYIENGSLVIEAIKTTGGQGGYTSARMITKGKYQFTYGTIAAKIQLPYGKGIWPAFWLLGANIDQVGWPSCGEIDVMEMIGGGNDNDSTVNGTLHWGEPGSQHAQYGQSKKLTAPLHESWHYFEADWTSSSILIKVDGAQYFVMDTSGAGKDEFRLPFFILLNLAIGGNWPGYPDDTTLFPQLMIVDWVRVYQ